jgi:hypothetical protein
MKNAWVAIMVCVWLMAACTKLPLVNAPREKVDINLVQNAHYDAGSKIRYMVSNDNDRIYLRFDTDNYGTISRIRKYGAIVHFDIEGKKKGPFWLKYPVYDQDNGGGMPIKDDDIVQGGFLGRNLFPPATNAVWHQGDETRAVDLGINAENFVCKAGLDSTDVLVYMVGVPFKLLGASRPEDLNNLNVLLEIPVAPDASKSSGTDMNSTGGVPGGNMAGGMPGGQGGNGQGGMNTMPGMGGMGQSSMPTPRSNNSGPSATRIWMQVKLSPSAAQ